MLFLKKALLILEAPKKNPEMKGVYMVSASPLGAPSGDNSFEGVSSTDKTPTTAKVERVVTQISLGDPLACEESTSAASSNLTGRVRLATAGSADSLSREENLPRMQKYLREINRHWERKGVDAPERKENMERCRCLQEEIAGGGNRGALKEQIFSSYKEILLEQLSDQFISMQVKYTHLYSREFLPILQGILEKVRGLVDQAGIDNISIIEAYQSNWARMDQMLGLLDCYIGEVLPSPQIMQMLDGFKKERIDNPIADLPEQASETLGEALDTLIETIRADFVVVPRGEE